MTHLLAIHIVASSTLHFSFFFHRGVSLNDFIPEDHSFHLNVFKIDLYIGFGILIGQERQKCFYFRHISKVPFIVFLNYSYEFLIQLLSYCCVTLILKNVSFYSLDWHEFFYQDLHRQVFSIKTLFSFAKWIVQCWIYHVCATWTICCAVWLRLFWKNHLLPSLDNFQSILIVWLWFFLNSVKILEILEVAVIAPCSKTQSDWCDLLLSCPLLEELYWNGAAATRRSTWTTRYQPAPSFGEPEHSGATAKFQS